MREDKCAEARRDTARSRIMKALWPGALAMAMAPAAHPKGLEIRTCYYTKGRWCGKTAKLARGAVLCANERDHSDALLGDHLEHAAGAA